MLIFALHVESCARRNVKLVANHRIRDTCLNALKWPDPRLWPLTYMGQQGAVETMTSNYPSARLPAPPRHRGRPPLTPRQRPSSSQTDSSRAIWRGATHSLGLPLRSARHTHTSHLDHYVQYMCEHRYPTQVWCL